jgi:hypothetical protein
MTNLKSIKTEIEKIISNPGIMWEDNECEYYVTKELYLMYFNGNLDIAEKFGDLRGKVKKQIISYVNKLVLSDLELMYFACKTGIHHNGRNIEWLKNEGLTVIEK